MNHCTSAVASSLRRASLLGRDVSLRVLLVVLMVSLACGGSDSRGARSAEYDPSVARYRLLLRHNPVDPGQAFRCYGGCQSHDTPNGYLECLSKCPAFEVTQGVACAADEFPPIAACITARRFEPQGELGPGYRVIGVIAGIALIVALGMACTNAQSCGAYYYYPGPGQPPFPNTGF